MINLINKIEEEFLNKISTKNSWGKNEVILLYKEVSLRVLSDAVFEKEENKVVKFQEIDNPF